MTRIYNLARTCRKTQTETIIPNDESEFLDFEKPKRWKEKKSKPAVTPNGRIFGQNGCKKNKHEEVVKFLSLFLKAYINKRFLCKARTTRSTSKNTAAIGEVIEKF